MQRSAPIPHLFGHLVDYLHAHWHPGQQDWTPKTLTAKNPPSLSLSLSLALSLCRSLALSLSRTPGALNNLLQPVAHRLERVLERLF